MELWQLLAGGRKTATEKTVVAEKSDGTTAEEGELVDWAVPLPSTKQQLVQPTAGRTNCTTKELYQP